MFAFSSNSRPAQGSSNVVLLIPLRVTSFACLLLFLAGPIGVAFGHDLKSNFVPMIRGLDKMGSDLCHSLKLNCTKSAKIPPRKARNPSDKPAAVRDDPSQTPKVTKTSPKPTHLPPGKPVPAAASAAATEKPDVLVPLPRAKPVVDGTHQAPAKIAAVGPESKPDSAKPAGDAPKSRIASLPPSQVIPLETELDCLAALRRGKADFDLVPAPAGS